MTDWYGYPYIALTGGADGALDSLDGSLLKDGDFAVVVVPSSKKSYVFSLDEDSGLAEDGLNVIAPDSNAGNKRWVRTNTPTDQYDITFYGAVGDGITDDTTAIQAAFDAGLGYVNFPPGTYLISDTISYTGRVFVTGYGATLLESTNLSKMLSLTDADDARIDGLLFEGVETYAVFAALSPSPSTTDYSAIYLSSSDRVQIKGVKSLYKRCLIYMDTCSDCMVDGWHCNGFMSSYDGTAPTGANYCPAVFVRGGAGDIITNGTVRNHGTGVLFGTNSGGTQPLYSVVSHITGENLKDDGVYGSSADYMDISHCIFKDVVTAGIEVRGSHNKVFENQVINANVGVVMTGRGNPTSNVSGGYNSIVNNDLSNCRANAIQVLGLDTGGGLGYIKGLTVTGNHIAGCPVASVASAAVDIQCAGDLTFKDNTIAGAAGTAYCVLIQGLDVSNPLVGLIVGDNNISGSTGRSIFLNWISGGSVAGNYAFNNGTPMIEGKYCAGVSFKYNTCTDQVVIILDDTYTNAGNIVMGNRGTLSLTQGVIDTCLVALNYTDFVTLNTLASTPVAVGQITFNNTHCYVSDGVTNANNWKAVS